MPPTDFALEFPRRVQSRGFSIAFKVLQFISLQERSDSPRLRRSTYVLDETCRTTAVESGRGCPRHMDSHALGPWLNVFTINYYTHLLYTLRSLDPCH
jgi:hypothetical protein